MDYGKEMRKTMFDIKQLPELNSDCFTYEIYESGGYRLLGCI